MNMDQIFSNAKKPKAEATPKSSSLTPAKPSLGAKLTPKDLKPTTGSKTDKKEPKQLGKVHKKIRKQGGKAEDDGKRRNTNDGLKVYTEAELRIGRGGNSPDCPFDCNCCF